MNKVKMNYKEICEKSMPVTFDSVGTEDGHEVERMWLADMVDGKWVEDYVVVRRDAYEIVTEADGAVFALIENGRMLVKAPKLKIYRIPEDVYRIAVNAFKDCKAMEELDVPYLVNDNEIDKAIQCFEKAERDGYEGLGDCYAIRGNKQLAANYYRKCLNQDYYDGKIELRRN